MPKASYKKRNDGRFAVRYKDKFFYGSTQSEANAKREAYKRKLAQGLREEMLGVPFAEYAIQWVEIYKSQCSKNTYNAYVGIVNRAIDQIGDIRMPDITQTDIQKLFNSIAGMSQSTIKKFCSTINSIFEAALHDRAILQNPCYKIRRPDGPKGTHRIITAEERQLIHDSIDKHDMALAAMIMLYAGLRRGEVIALDDSCIDMEAERINVSQGVFFDGNTPVLSTPKTASGIRSIPIFEPLKKPLQAFSGRVLSTEMGGIMTESAFNRKWESYMVFLETQANGCHKRWYGKTKEHKKILSEGGKLPPWKEIFIRPHDLRHSFVTMLYDAGVDLKTAMRWVGHADEKMIMQIYAHLTDERETRSENQVAKHIENTIR